MTLLEHLDAELVLKNATIRKAELQDADGIHEVLMQAFKGLEGRGYSSQAIETAIIGPDAIRKRIHLGGHVLVAELDSEIIGTVAGLEEHKSMHICSLAVDPKYQNCGVARKLMEYLERIAQSKHCCKLFLCTAWAMKEAIQLYESLDYVREGHLRKHFYGENLVVFSKLIKTYSSKNEDQKRRHS